MNFSPNVFDMLTDGPVVNWTPEQGVFNASLLLNHATATRQINISGLMAGGMYALVFRQDGTGGAAVTLAANPYAWVGTNGGAKTLTSAAKAVDVLFFRCDGAGNVYFQLQQNLQPYSA
jgi:hypothetical protein